MNYEPKCRFISKYCWEWNYLNDVTALCWFANKIDTKEVKKQILRSLCFLYCELHILWIMLLYFYQASFPQKAKRPESIFKSNHLQVSISIHKDILCVLKNESIPSSNFWKWVKIFNCLSICTKIEGSSVYGWDKPLFPVSKCMCICSYISILRLGLTAMFSEVKRAFLFCKNLTTFLDLNFQFKKKCFILNYSIYLSFCSLKVWKSSIINATNRRDKLKTYIAEKLYSQKNCRRKNHKSSPTFYEDEV